MQQDENALKDNKEWGSVFPLGTDRKENVSFFMVFQFIVSGIAGQDLAPFPKPIGGVVSGS